MCTTQPGQSYGPEDRILQLTEPRRQGVNNASNSVFKRFPRFPFFVLFLLYFYFIKQLKEREFAHLVVTNRDTNQRCLRLRFISGLINLSTTVRKLSSATISSVYFHINQFISILIKASVSVLSAQQGKWAVSFLHLRKPPPPAVLCCSICPRKPVPSKASDPACFYATDASSHLHLCHNSQWLKTQKKKNRKCSATEAQES